MTGDNLTRAIETLGLLASREDAPAAVSVHYRPTSDGFHRWAITTRPARTADMREGSYYYGATLGSALREAFADESNALVHHDEERERIDVTEHGTKEPAFIDGPPVPHVTYAGYYRAALETLADRVGDFVTAYKTGPGVIPDTLAAMEEELGQARGVLE